MKKLVSHNEDTDEEEEKFKRRRVSTYLSKITNASKNRVYLSPDTKLIKDQYRHTIDTIPSMVENL